MKLQITYKGFEKKDKKDLKKFIAEKVAELEHKLGGLIHAESCLRGTLEKHSKMPLVRMGVTLHLPKKDIASEEEGEDSRDVINKVFYELERQGLKHKSRLKNHPAWKRKARRKQLKLQLAGTAGEVVASDQATPQQAADWFDTVQPYLDDLYNFSVWEITYLQNLGDLTPDDILPDELVDEVLVTAFEKLAEKPPAWDTESWLFKFALEILDREVEKSQQRRQAVSLESVIPVEDIDTQIYEFYQPEEILKLEDLIPATGSTALPADAIAEQREMHHSLVKLPKTWRRIKIMHEAIGLSVPQIAAIMAIRVATVESLLAMAEQFIIDHAGQYGKFTNFPVRSVMKSAQKPSYSNELLSELEHKFKG